MISLLGLLESAAASTGGCGASFLLGQQRSWPESQLSEVLLAAFPAPTRAARAQHPPRGDVTQLDDV